MFKYVRISVVSFLVALAFAASASPAFAATSTWSMVDVGLHGSPSQPMLVVTGRLPDTVALPHEAELAVPSGTQLRWLGEVLGGPPEDDPSLQYSMRTVDGLDIYTFTMRASRIAGFEGVATGMTGVQGQTQTSAIRWTAWKDLPSVRVSQRLPRGTLIVQPATGASMLPGDGMYSFYSRTFANVKAGDVLDLSFSYTPPAAVPAAGSSQPGSDVIVPVFIVAAVLLMLALVLAVSRTKRAPLAVEVEEEPVAPKAMSVKKPAQVASRSQANAASARAMSVKKPAQAASQSQANAASARATSAKKPVKTAVKETAPAATRKTGLRLSQLLIPAVLMVALVVAVVILADPGGPRDDQVSKYFGGVDPCASASFVVVPNPNVNLAERAEDLLDAFIGYEGIADVTFTRSTSVLDVTYCKSKHSEQDIRAIVERSGLVTFAPSP